MSDSRERGREGSRAPVAYALGGAAMALGAPAGWLAVRLAASPGRLSVAAELAANSPLYAYLLLSTTVAFAAFGYALGTRAEALRRDATRDAVTGLANRRALDDALDRAVAEAERYGAPLAVALFDLDRFKLVNDRHGHAAGDEALRAVAAALAGSARRADVVGRYGGEEFLLVLPRTTADEALALVERALDAIRAVEVPLRDESLRVTASCGVAGGVPCGVPCGVPGGATWRSELLDAADRALYVAKGEGRDRAAAGRVAG